MSATEHAAGPVRVVTATCPDRETALVIADDLVARHLAACAQVGGPITSVYRWEGRVERDDEWLLTVKTDVAAVELVVGSIVGSHPYDVPEVLVTTVDGGHRAYLDWVRGAVAASSSSSEEEIRREMERGG